MNEYDAERDTIAEREELEALRKAIEQRPAEKAMARLGNRRQRYGMGESQGNGADFISAAKAAHWGNPTAFLTVAPTPTVQRALFCKEA